MQQKHITEKIKKFKKMSDHTLKRLTKKFFSPKGSANRLKTTDSEGRLGRKHERSECLAAICRPFHIERYADLFTSFKIINEYNNCYILVEKKFKIMNEYNKTKNSNRQKNS